jgi:hypothetical protein
LWVMLLIFVGVSMFYTIRDELREKGHRAAYPGIGLLLLVLLLFGLYKLITYLISLATSLGYRAYEWYIQLLPPGIGEKVCVGIMIIFVVIFALSVYLNERNSKSDIDDDYY